MKVLVITNLYPPDVIGGYELGCRQVVEQLSAKGIEMRVATCAPRGPVVDDPEVRRVFSLADQWSSYLNRHRTWLQWDLHFAASYRISAFNVHALLNQIAEFQPDVCYVWSLEGLGGLGLMGCLSFLGIPWVWHLMDRVPAMVCNDRHGPVPPLVREFNRHIRGTYLACSQTLLDEIASEGVVLRDDVEMMPNWIAGPHAPLRTQYLEGGVLKIMHAAAQLWDGADKGTDLVVRAAAKLLERGHTNFLVDLYGNVADTSIGDLILSLGLSDRVRLLGWRTQAELRELHSQYDVFVFPTRAREPFAFAPLEASAAGCVSILSRLCGISEWMVHGVHALKVDRDPDQIASMLEGALDGTYDLPTIGRRGAAVVRRDFHLDTISERIVAALERARATPRPKLGNQADALRLALMAERLNNVWIQERACA